ncbi:MAG: hypothetical protein JKY51_06650 [Opitutaceae bacterium]|nr:hypothetical protein [Opitutaceae bacterium]
MSISIHQKNSPSFDPNLRWALSCASGYLQLGLFSEGARELSSLGLEYQTEPQVLELRIRILIARKQCGKAAKLAKLATRLHPNLIDFYILTALAYDEKGNPKKAKEVWLSVPYSFQGSGFLHYEIARCEKKLGNHLSAHKHIEEAIKIDGDISQSLIDYSEMNPTTEGYFI